MTAVAAQKSAIQPYTSWKKASKAAIALGITTMKEYQSARKSDCKLPACPNLFYSTNWPGWKTFLAK